MKKRIKCGSRDVTISHTTGHLGWLKLNDLGSVSHFAMDASAARKVAAALLTMADSLDRPKSNRKGGAA